MHTLGRSAKRHGNYTSKDRAKIATLLDLCKCRPSVKCNMLMLTQFRQGLECHRSMVTDVWSAKENTVKRQNKLQQQPEVF